MKKQVTSPTAPAAIGPYSQAIETEHTVYCSGQLGIDPTINALAGDSVEDQTHQALRNMQEIMAATGLTLADVVKTTVFLKNMYDFAAMNEIYSTYFSQPYPARSTIEVAALPKNGRVEIECIAIKK
ncbi:MAG: hypothetical protein UU47_C0019G0010 [candidate division TM6 bacterium GW2011_GWE2_41_16]|nr:MAG: hypothetical protein UU47_C0019G0010 [candidate division TM6 bacterium GW2011_GWE2_41_16]